VVGLLAAGIAAAQTSFKTIYNFTGGADGAGPAAPLIFAPGGSLLGTAATGGNLTAAACQISLGCGTVFKIAPPSSAGGAWAYQVTHTFAGAPSDGAYPYGPLSIASGGALYGTTESGGTGPVPVGTVFELKPPAATGGAWGESVLFSFGTMDEQVGSFPTGSLTISPQGAIYGCTVGSVYVLEPPRKPGGPWTPGTLNNQFGGGVTSGPTGVILGANHTVYFASEYGTPLGFSPCSQGGCGAFGQLTPPVKGFGPYWALGWLYQFEGAPGDAANPVGQLVQGPNGVLYGASLAGGGSTQCQILGQGCGTVFQLTPPPQSGGPWTEAVLYNFTGQNGDGAYPWAGVILDASGNIYGTTYGGGYTASCPQFGNIGCGTVYKLSPPSSAGGSWTETVLHSFAGPDGSFPAAPPVLGADGARSGTTRDGGASGYGTVYRLKP
jgi:hypothetical protein